ncbi:hypothetical protein T01_7585 [Trichinella spiralis]|uniref:Uncharacterized protein n=1 Tax=Trichinella spiralis TaxID=6334 RepID=A0A0V1AX86_TRISP|nr:hypothetical protein T01_7585 [Trichinella spiralis]
MGRALGVHAELHLCLRTIGTHLKSTGMCCQIRSSTITSPRIVNNCLSLSIIVFQGISVIAMTHDHFENASTTLHNVFPSNNPAKLVCNQRYKGYLEFSKSGLEFQALRVLADVKLQIT